MRRKAVDWWSIVIIYFDMNTDEQQSYYVVHIDVPYRTSIEVAFQNGLRLTVDFFRES